jgi:uncharacterized protein (TIGR02466 family)
MSGPRIPAAALLREGVQAQQSGRLAQAEAAYRQVLQQHPEQPDALQLLGLLASRVGNLPVAEDLMRRSLRARPNQAHVWNNLGNLLLDTSRVEQALGSFEQALRLDPHYVDAHYNRARAWHQAGRLDEAARGVQEALAAAPQPTAALLQLVAQIQDDQGDLEGALATLEQALSLAPDRPALLHNKATLLQRRHRHAQALALHERALMLGLDAADAHYNHGNSLQSVGRLEDAVQAYRRALARQPGHRLALYDLARLRWRLGDEPFDAELLQAQQTDPRSPVAAAVRGQLLLRAERFAEAAEAYAEAVRRAGEVAAHHDGLGQALARLGEFEASLDAHARAVALAPIDPTVRINQAASLLMAGQPAAAADAAEVARTLSPDDQNAWALKGLAWRRMGDRRGAWLNDLRWVQVVDLDAPAGCGDMAAFSAELAREIRALHHDRAAPVDQTLRRGTQTPGDIFEQGHPKVNAIKDCIAQAVDRYVSDLPSDPDHPLLRRRSRRWRFADSWSSRLGPGGYHTHHVHPHGWISAVVYVTVPPSAKDALGRPGWLQLGQSDLGLGTDDSPMHFIQPQPGRLVLFPSYLWHGTVPFSEGAERLTLAFDVLPV